jgi:hypothetical protein
LLVKAGRFSFLTAQTCQNDEKPCPGYKSICKNRKFFIQEIPTFANNKKRDIL